MTQARAYIGSFTSAGGAGVTAVDLDPRTGALTAPAATDAVPDPSFLALSGDGRTLYAVSETADGGAAALRTTAAGAPEPLGPVVPAGGGPTHLALAPGGRHLLTADYGSGSVTVLPLLADGSVGGPARTVRYSGSGPDAERQEGPHVHMVLPDPDGRWILSADLGTDTVRVSALDPARGVLRHHGELRLRPGIGPRHLTFHPNGRLLYVVNELEPVVTVCRWDPRRGELERAGETALVPAGGGGPRPYPSELVVAPHGRTAWAAVRGRDTVAVLDLEDGGERPVLRTEVPCGGRWPRHLVLDAPANRLYAANEHSGDVTWFDVDPGSGVPVRSGSLPVAAASCVLLARGR
ncbi:lactonase family protein [Streptomyces thermolineatus]|uniref:lactonase family protein n=1 Tax=Streptomyces thermolineatus TaxID=44033 RepID=UPI00384A47E0